jgi:hypothetical protein
VNLIKNNRFFLIAGSFILSGIIFFGLKPFLSPVKSTPVGNLRDQLSSAQLSYFGRLDNNNTENNSLITVTTNSGTAPSNNNYNLFIGDTLAIAKATGGSSLYTVSDVANANAIFINTGLNPVNTFTGAYVVATRSAVHNISFSPSTSIQDGKWQVLIKASGFSAENSADGMPDQGGFDAKNLQNSDVTCPWGATASVGTTVVLTSGVSVGATGPYHLITCALPTGGTNPVGTGATGTIIIGGSNQLINPAPAVSHTVGQANASADTYTLLIRHLDENNNLINSDTTIGKIALTESVQVTATIDPTITFYVDSVGTSTPGLTRCGTTLSAGAAQTTSTSVNFGSISLGQFNTLAQRFTCSTNAINGYAVQIFENQPLTVTSGDATTIPDTTCDPSTSCSLDTANNWSNNVSNSQFGYSLESINSSPVSFTAGSDFTAKPFGQGYNNARVIMNRTSTPSTEDRGYICYRITASNYQQAGTYQNQISFIATATF